MQVVDARGADNGDFDQVFDLADIYSGYEIDLYLNRSVLTNQIYKSRSRLKIYTSL